MDVPINPLKRALRDGRRQIGLWCTLSNHVTAEIVAGAGFDWLLIDTEHSPNDLALVHQQLQAVANGTAHPVVRIPSNDVISMKRYLDIGAQTIMIPCIESEQEARDAVSYLRYPPRGVRGYGGPTRASRFDRIAHYARRCEEELCLVLQIETKDGLENLEKIANVDGVDAIFIGPADLAASLGHLDNIVHPAVQNAVTDAIKRTHACGKPSGILTLNETLARRYLDLGATMVAVGIDTAILADSTDKLAAKFKTE